jgi:hypothetical protein
LEDCLWLQFGLHEDLVHRHVKEPISFECHRSRLSAIKSIPPGKFQIRFGKNASGHTSQVERSRISSSVENLNIPRGSCNVTNKEDFKIDFHRRSRELFYLLLFHLEPLKDILQHFKFVNW